MLGHDEMTHTKKVDDSSRQIRVSIDLLLDVNYFLEDLPAGYGTFEIDQPSGTQVYKRLFGHPSGKFYDSILKFEPHFFWLLDGRQGVCSCVNCGNVKSVPGPPRVRNKLDIIGSSSDY